MITWDFVLSGLVLVFFGILGWLVLWPHGESWVPIELEPDLPDTVPRSAPPEHPRPRV